jgi:protein O-GlcNAc transferase
MAHQGLNDKDFQIEMKNILTRLCPDLHYFAPFLLNEGIVNNPDRRTLKIGFISSHFTDHSIGRMLVEMITFMADQLTIDFSDSPSNRPDVLVYFLDGQFSQETQLTSAHDHITGTFEKFLGNRFIRLPLYNISYIQDRIAADQLDVLVFSDLGMDLSTYLLAFSRLAIYQVSYSSTSPYERSYSFDRWQVAWWGHPITSGLETIDYFFSIEDETSLPTSFAPTDVQYTEQLVRMDYVNSIPLLEVSHFCKICYVSHDFNTIFLFSP